MMLIEICFQYFNFRRHNCMQDEFSYLLNQRCSLELYPEENAWHYITVQPTVSNKIIEFSISVVITGKQRLFTSLYNTTFGHKSKEVITYFFYFLFKLLRVPKSQSMPVEESNTRWL